MQIHEVTNRDIWNAFVFNHAPRSGAFLQSWEWGAFQRAAGHRVRRVVLTDSDGPHAAAQIIETRLPFGQRYLFCPRGPLVSDSTTPRLHDSLALLSAVAKKTRALFARFESLVPTTNNRQLTTSVSPAHTLITDLTLTYDDLAKQQHPKTRYNIGLAERKGVAIEIHRAFEPALFEEVWNLFVATAERGHFRLHPKSYYRTMLSTLNTDACRAFLAVARYEGEVLAANVMIDFHGTRTYLHGASGNTHRDVMAPYLLHWALIQEAKHAALRAYDWWGVAPEGADASHPWAGITRFKLGFGGARIDYPGTFDLVTRPFAYRLYQTVRSIRRGRRS